MENTRQSELEHALLVSAEHLAIAGKPKQNWGQYLAMVANALGVTTDDERLVRLTRLYRDSLRRNTL